MLGSRPSAVVYGRDALLLAACALAGEWARRGGELIEQGKLADGLSRMAKALSKLKGRSVAPLLGGSSSPGRFNPRKASL